MTVISDTSPLNYLVLIDLQDVLPALFGHVLIPEAVWHELRSPAAPQPVKDFLDSWPRWLDCRVVSQVRPDLQQLDPGEQEAIALAQSVGASLVLLDEKRGRQAARDLGLAVSGTLGVLDLAARRGLVDLADALKRLERTTGGAKGSTPTRSGLPSRPSAGATSLDQLFHTLSTAAFRRPGEQMSPFETF